MTAPAPCWDIFCTVIDNFGDIGVTWRLARQLAAEHRLPVRLWVDDLESFRLIWPEVDPAQDVQRLLPSPPEGIPIGHEGLGGKGAAYGSAHASPSPQPIPVGRVRQHPAVEVRRWIKPLPEVDPGKVIIESLACHLPEAFVARMAALNPKPLWLNLEYLTAERWTKGVHGLPSPHPRLPLTKFFYMPGYTPDTGGLTRESWLLPERDAFQASTRERQAFWSGLGLPAEQAGELRISLFGYENRAVASLLGAWSRAPHPIRVLVPQGRILPQLAAWFGVETPPAGVTLKRDRLTLHVLPMLHQDAYDRLLWACDLNFVRGEDSFVRAQFAARPLVWQAYRQEKEVHFAKLDAFLDLYHPTMPDDLGALTRAFWQAWNREADPAQLWPDLAARLPELAGHARLWSEHLASQPDLASKLLIFCEKKLE